MEIGVDSFVAATVDAAGRAVDPRDISASYSKQSRSLTRSASMSLASVNTTGASSSIPRQR
jgi:hypothetical protein